VHGKNAHDYLNWLGAGCR